MKSLFPYPRFAKSDPRFYPSKDKRPDSPLIFFVHFYGGHQRVLKRHIQLVNELGFDAFAFNMPVFSQFRFPLCSGLRFGMKHIYADMITYYLDQLQGMKLVYSFSNPGASAIEALALRMPAKKDVLGLICDSGPSQEFSKSAWNLAIKVQKSWRLLLLFLVFWSFRRHHDLPFHLRMLPDGFPVLSIRGGQDVVIPPWHIEKTFRAQKHLLIQITELPEAGHLDGLKRFPDEYRENVAAFLDQVMATYPVDPGKKCIEER